MDALVIYRSVDGAATVQSGRLLDMVAWAERYASDCVGAGDELGLTVSVYYGDRVQRRWSIPRGRRGEDMDMGVGNG